MLERSEGMQMTFGGLSVMKGGVADASFDADEITGALLEIEKRVLGCDWRFGYYGGVFPNDRVEVYIGDFDDAPGRVELGFEAIDPATGRLRWMPSKLLLSGRLRREALWWTLIHYAAHLAHGLVMQAELLCDMNWHSSYRELTVDKFLERFKKRVRSSASWRERHSHHGSLWRSMCRAVYGRRVSDADLLCPPQGWAYDDYVHDEGLLAVYPEPGQRRRLLDRGDWKVLA